jgi:hypothetical protein
MVFNDYFPFLRLDYHLIRFVVFLCHACSASGSSFRIQGIAFLFVLGLLLLMCFRAYQPCYVAYIFSYIMTKKCAAHVFFKGDLSFLP